MNIKTFYGMLLGFILAAPVSAAQPNVEFFSPQGEVKGVRQVTVRFSEQIVPFGDPRLVEPFDITARKKAASGGRTGKLDI